MSERTQIGFHSGAWYEVDADYETVKRLVYDGCMGQPFEIDLPTGKYGSALVPMRLLVNPQSVAYVEGTAPASVSVPVVREQTDE